MITRLLRQITVQKRIVAAFALLALALLFSLPLLIYNYHVFVSRLTYGTENDREIDRLYMMAAITIMDSRVEVGTFLLGIESDVQDADHDVDEAIAMIHSTHKLLHSDGHRMDKGDLIDNLLLYKEMIYGLDRLYKNGNLENDAQELTLAVDRIYLLSASLADSIESLVAESNQHVIQANLH